MISKTLERKLDEIGRRYRRVTLARLVLRSVFVGGCVTTLVDAAIRLGWNRPSLVVVIAVFLAAAALTFALGYRPPPGRLFLARLADQRLDLKDRLATAVEWEDRASPLVTWLLQDADQQARFLDPRAVVPVPVPAPRQAFAWLALASALVALWTAPLPSGLFLRPAQTAAQGVMDQEELEMLERIASLRQQIAGLRTPEMRRLDRDLAQLQAGLRDRALPKDEAVALLRYFERRAQSTLREQLQDQPAADELGLDRIQDLAERLLVVGVQEGAPSSGANVDSGQLSPFGPREVSESDLPPELLEVLRRIAELDSRPGETGMAGPGVTNQGGAGGQEAGPQADEAAASESAGLPRPGRQGQEAAAEAQPGSDLGSEESEPGLPSPSGGSVQDGADTQGPSSPHGVGDTGTSTGTDGEYQSPPQSLRILQRLFGELQAGPLHVGQVHTSVGEQDDSPIGLSPSSPASPGSEESRAVERETVPLAYREAVRRYFQGLEPDR